MTATFTRRYDRWDLDTLRAGKAVRDELGEVIPELDAMLAEAEAQLTVGVLSSLTPVADAPEAPRGTGSGTSSSGSNRNAPTEGQLRFIASLARDLGTELETPRDKSHASLIIDRAKKALAARPAAARPVRPATENQCAYLRSLVAERETPVDPANADRITPEVTGFDLARQLIDAYTALPRRARAVPSHGIREGRYAFTPDGGTTTEFYRVTRTGRIKVWTAGGEWPYNGKLNAALTWIAANPREAAALFGQLTETCGRCGRELSNDDSRALGLGPDCAAKSDW